MQKEQTAFEPLLIYYGGCSAADDARLEPGIKIYALF